MSDPFLPSTTRAETLLLRVKPPTAFPPPPLWDRIQLYRLDSRGLHKLTSDEALPASTSYPCPETPEATRTLQGLGGKELLFRVNGEVFSFLFPEGSGGNPTFQETLDAWNTHNFPARIFVPPEKSSGDLGVATLATGGTQVLEFAHNQATNLLGFIPGKIYQGTVQHPPVTYHITEHTIFDSAYTNESRYYFCYLGNGMRTTTEAAVITTAANKRVLGQARILDSQGKPFPSVLVHISHDSFYTSDNEVVPANSLVLRTDHDGWLGVHLLPSTRYRFHVPGIGLLTYFITPPEGGFNILDPIHADQETNLGVAKPYWGELTKRTL